MRGTVKRLVSLLSVTALLLTFGTISSPIFADENRENIITELRNTVEVGGVAYSSAEAYEGNWSIHVGYDSGWSEHPIAAMCADFGMTSGGTYDISFYFKGAVESLYITAKSLCIWGNENYIEPPKYPDVGQKITPLENGWYKFEVRNYILSDANKELLYTTNGGNDGNIVDNFYLDNLSVIDKASGKELIQNGGFEPGGTIDPPTPPDPTEPPDGPVRKEAPFVRELLHEEAEAGIAYSSAQAYDGKWSVHVNQAKELAPAPEKFGIEPGKTYNASFYIKGNIGSLYFSFTGSTRVLVTNTEIRSGSLTDIKKVPVENGWYKIEINNAPAAAAGWTPAFLLAEGSPDFYLDKLSVTELDESGNTVRELIENGSFEPPAMEFGDYKIVDDANGEKTVSIDVINHSAGENASVQLILAAYSDTFMTAYVKDETPTFIEDNDKWVTLTQAIRVNNGDKATAYLWDSVEGMKMLLPSQPLTK